MGQSGVRSIMKISHRKDTENYPPPERLDHKYPAHLPQRRSTMWGKCCNPAHRSVISSVL